MAETRSEAAFVSEVYIGSVSIVCMDIHCSIAEDEEYLSIQGDLYDFECDLGSGNHQTMLSAAI